MGRLGRMVLGKESKHSKTSNHPQGAFVGGFGPGDGSQRPHVYPQQGYTSPFPPPLPPKPQMAMPEPMYFDAAGPGPSLTTQFALQQLNGQSVPNLPTPPVLLRPPADAPLRPHSDSDVPRPHASPPETRPSASSPATPPKSTDKLDVSSSPTSGRGRRKSSPGSMDGTVLCSGTTKAGERCKNSAKRPTALGHLDSDADQEIERYCHVHMKEVLKPSGFQSPCVNEWVSYDDWIPLYLQDDTRAALRFEMNKPASASDRDGYIYTFEIRDTANPDSVHLKVGRTVNLVKRINEWSKQCESKEQVLRGYWPGDGTDDASNLMKGRVKVGDPGKYCYRLERLIHLELADLIVNRPYLLSGYPKLTEAPERNAKPPPKRKCPDCGKMHKEIFTFSRITNGKRKGREYETIVKPVVEKWGRYVEKYVDRPSTT
ncbi:uncharacterized protein PHACADRAFT_256946 [Phanerochaete carnosa HHB-10118-sp]|uniref:DUF1766-domain-containing protein n=1 Tax=Phanerochaete carnosa (strain HHB-10118-sp) TaxID=650164 RepID=K5WAG7_PHACS|nr:uncharacterized protein PHACADRAFT_256946 [Phanerochaete carnosa HHB-10118-sp]EKM55964.1 hypothetical protein PHACADRAFT_256946 [Phanerochaete carnosa HHB-10118-sp]